METWVEERVNRLELSVKRCRKGADMAAKPGDQVAEMHFLRKESSICLKRALALWWGLRWGGRASRGTKT